MNTATVIDFDKKAEEVTLKKFVALKAQIDKLQEEYEDLKPQILEFVSAKSNEVACCDGRYLTISKRGTYEYSEKVYKLEKMVKSMKKGEEQSGLCKLTNVKKYIVVK